MRGVNESSAWRWLVKRGVHAVLLPLVRLALWLAPQARHNQPVQRSLWSGTPIITLGVKARAERLLGVDAESLVYETYQLTDQFDRNLSRWMRGPLRLVVPYLVFAWACLRYQRFHFFYDRGLLPQLEPGQFNPSELFVLHALGKELFFYAYGADVRTQVRTRALGPVQLCAGCPQPGRHCVCDDRRGSENYHRIRNYATCCFSQGDMLEYTPGSRNDLAYWPIDLEAERGQRYAPHYPQPDATRALRVVHAPNHRHFKGTSYLLDAVTRLQAEGLAIELVLVEEKSNREALDIYRSADVIFDQCLAGYHGYFALEALALGKPVLAYIRKPHEYLPDSQDCPLINTRPETLLDDLRELLLQRDQLAALGRRGRVYIERHFSLPAFAARLAGVYRELADRPAASTRLLPMIDRHSHAA